MPAERTDEEIAWEALAEVPDTWSINSWEFRLIVRRACENARAQGVAEGMEKGTKWSSIETAPETGAMESVRVLLWGAAVGCRNGEIHNYRGYLFASIPCLHGNAIEHWGVTHWMHLPPGPSAIRSLAADPPREA